MLAPSSGGLPNSPTGTFSPLRSNLDEMRMTCMALEKHIAVMKGDEEEFGLLTEESYCYDAPQVLANLQRISRTAAVCTQDIGLDDEAFETDEAGLSVILFSFLSEHRRILDQLTALGSTLKSTGSLYGTLGHVLHRQGQIVSSLRSALDARYLTLKVRTAPDWMVTEQSMRCCLEVYPVPCDE